MIFDCSGTEIQSGELEECLDDQVALERAWDWLTQNEDVFGEIQKQFRNNYNADFTFDKFLELARNAKCYRDSSGQLHYVLPDIDYTFSL